MAFTLDVVFSLDVVLVSEVLNLQCASIVEGVGAGSGLWLALGMGFGLGLKHPGRLHTV